MSIFIKSILVLFVFTNLTYAGPNYTEKSFINDLIFFNYNNPYSLNISNYKSTNTVVDPSSAELNTKICSQTDISDNTCLKLVITNKSSIFNPLHADFYDYNKQIFEQNSNDHSQLNISRTDKIISQRLNYLFSLLKQSSTEQLELDISHFNIVNFKLSPSVSGTDVNIGHLEVAKQYSETLKFYINKNVLQRCQLNEMVDYTAQSYYDSYLKKIEDLKQGKVIYYGESIETKTVLGHLSLSSQDFNKLKPTYSKQFIQQFTDKARNQYILALENLAINRLNKIRELDNQLFRLHEEFNLSLIRYNNLYERFDQPNFMNLKNIILTGTIKDNNINYLYDILKTLLLLPYHVKIDYKLLTNIKECKENDFSNNDDYKSLINNPRLNNI